MSLFEAVFHNNIKHLKIYKKYYSVCCIFNSLLNVWSCDETLWLMFDTYHFETASLLHALHNTHTDVSFCYTHNIIMHSLAINKN